MSGYLGRQAPEFLAVLLSVVASPADEGSWQRRRFRKAGRIRHVQLLTHLRDWVQACQEDHPCKPRVWVRDEAGGTLRKSCWR